MNYNHILIFVYLRIPQNRKAQQHPAYVFLTSTHTIAKSKHSYTHMWLSASIEFNIETYIFLQLLFVKHITAKKKKNQTQLLPENKWTCKGIPVNITPKAMKRKTTRRESFRVKWSCQLKFSNCSHNFQRINTK